MRVGKDGETGILINCSWGCEMVHAGIWNDTAALKNNLTVSKNAIHTSVYDISSHSNIMKAYAPCLVAKLCPTLCDPITVAWQSPVHGDSPGKNTGVGCHAFLQGIFTTQESNPGLPHCRQILYCLSYQENPWILEWAAYPFSWRSSWPRK